MSDMAEVFANDEERRIAEALAGIAFANPFSDDREPLERVVLGAAYRTPERFLLPGQPLHRLEGNLGALLERAEVILRDALAKVSRRSKPPSDEVRVVLEGVGHFVVFHRHAAGFDGLIGPAAATGGVGEADARRRVSPPALFDRVRRDLEVLMGPVAGLEEVARMTPRWFAFYFQIRRAWVHTYTLIHGGSPALRRLRARIWQSIFTHDMRRYQRGLHERMGDITTLITGASGTGKELVARAVGWSRFVPFDPKERAFAGDFAASLHPLNLSALTPTLIESELFGHRRGAFTGALGERAGFFETCGPHGTVFLDEIGETAPEIQVKLLRVLQTRQFNRLGETSLQSFRGRVLAATNRDLAAEIRAGRFREDLYFRLCADRVDTPSLCEVLDGDRGELPCLVAHVCAALAGPAEAASLAGQVLEVIGRRLGADYPWPGNFRELEQCARNVLVHGDYLPPLPPAPTGNAGDWLEEARAGSLTMDEILGHYCGEILAETGSLEAAARRLGVDRRTVRRYARAVRGARA